MVKISVKPLKGETFTVEVDEEAKIEELKKKIAEAKPEYTPELQKLIYAGKILTDPTTVKESQIKPEGFVVIMLAKAKAPAGGGAASEAPAAQPAPAATPAAAPAAAPAAPSPAPGAPADGDAPMGYEQAASNLVTGTGMEATVTQLCDMGFPREQVIRCLQAAFNNPDRAVEYLMGGIPEGIMAAPGGEGAAAPPAASPAAAPGAGAPPGGAAFPAMTAGGGGGGGGGGPVSPALEQLRNSPQFGQLARAVAQNPQMLAQILPVIAQQQPEIVEAIQADPEGFQRLLQEAAAGGGQPQDPVAAMLAAAGGGGQPGGGGPPPGQNVVRLSEEESAAVERLTAMGFDRNMAAQAYFACEKNEEQAANFLMDNAGMDMD